VLPPRSRAAFRAALLHWYQGERRDLPWRRTRDPYKIWVSEIMLQQTRVAAVLAHYREFLKRFPTMRVLAAASEADVLAAWSGLGYYRRARMLRQGALAIVEGGGKLPRGADELQQLPGIGRYTAAAIASIAFDEPRAVVDGNVERVLERISGRTLTANETWQTAQELLDGRTPGDWNQAVMELGALVCMPMHPACGKCPVRKWCATRGRPSLSRKEPIGHKAELRQALCVRGDKVLLKQRSRAETVMSGMWELPSLTDAQAGAEPRFRLKHAIMQTTYSVEIFEQVLVGKTSGARWVQRSDLARLPLTGLARKVLRRAGALA
jgi:A/G-specific adenine glycosylase